MEIERPTQPERMTLDEIYMENEEMKRRLGELEAVHRDLIVQNIELSYSSKQKPRPSSELRRSDRLKKTLESKRKELARLRNANIRLVKQVIPELKARIAWHEKEKEELEFEITSLQYAEQLKIAERDRRHFTKQRNDFIRQIAYLDCHLAVTRQQLRSAKRKLNRLSRNRQTMASCSHQDRPQMAHC